MHPHKNQQFMARLQFAWAGLWHGVRAERSLKVHVFTFVLVVAVLAILRPEPIWWALVLMASFLVLAAELFNTALEHLADHLHPEIHPQIRVVKDCAAAAVLMTVCGAVAVGIALIMHVLRRSG
jgi:diacylglycerol kinase (ATP)